MSKCTNSLSVLFVMQTCYAYVSVPIPRCRGARTAFRCQADPAGDVSYVDELVQKAKARVPEKWLTPSPYDSGDSAIVQRLPLPGFGLESFGIRGRWQVVGDNFVLKPLPSIKPVGVIHFIGGAFVGSAPHLAYRYLLDELADEGYVIIATPYKLTFNYLELCADIVARWEQTRAVLGTEFGQLPTIGLGHSCGSVLQVLISSLFPEVPRDANVLISFNNKPAKDSIPNYEDVVIPFAKTVTERGQAQVALREFIERAVDQAENFAYDFARSPLAPASFGGEVLPIAREALPAVLQVTDLLQMLGTSGVQEFSPTPTQVAAVLAERYPLRPTMVVKFSDDSIDESDSLFSLLDARRRRLAAGGEDEGGGGVGGGGEGGGGGGAAAGEPAVGGGGAAGDVRVDLKVLQGTHVTPLLQDIPTTPLDSFDPLINFRRAARAVVLAPTHALRTAVVAFLRSSLPPGGHRP